MPRHLAHLLAIFLVMVILRLTAADAGAAAATQTEGLQTGTAAGSITIPLPDAPIVPLTHPDPCPALPQFTKAENPLLRVGEALQPGGHLDILAVGSGTTRESDAGQIKGSFPYFMAASLKAASPQTDITLTLDGSKGLTAFDMLKIFDTELTAHKFQLVLWQTGTVEAVKGMPPEGLRAALADGAERVRAAGGDLVLIDSQYSRLLQTKAKLEPYQAALLKVSAVQGVSLFHRFDLMQNWVQHGGIDLERAAPADRQKTAGLLRDCLGRALALMVLDGAGRLPSTAPVIH